MTYEELTRLWEERNARLSRQSLNIRWWWWYSELWKLNYLQWIFQCSIVPVYLCVKNCLWYNTSTWFKAMCWFQICVELSYLLMGEQSNCTDISKKFHMLWKVIYKNFIHEWKNCVTVNAMQELQALSTAVHATDHNYKHDHSVKLCDYF